MKHAHKLSRKEEKIIKAERATLCGNMSFVAAEAYKLLRTNLMFALPDNNNSIIGITSSVRGEGKSTASVNLAYTFSQSGKKVLLIDADMRLPSIAKKLNIHNGQGLSNLIAGVHADDGCIKKMKDYDNLYVLTAGEIPPNPSELLGSERMKALLDRLKQQFDIIVVDLPPINIVADALVLSKWTDGLIIVVRQNYTAKSALADCMYQVNKLGVKFLGYIFSDVNIALSAYKHYGKYGGYDYNYGYAASESEAKDDELAHAFINATKEEHERV